MYSNRENKRLSIFSISLALLLGASNISLITYLVSTANHKSIPSFDIPVGPYTSYRLTATKNGYTLSYKANDPKKLLTRTRTSTPKESFGSRFRCAGYKLRWIICFVRKSISILSCC